MNPGSEGPRGPRLNYWLNVLELKAFHTIALSFHTFIESASQDAHNRVAQRRFHRDWEHAYVAAFCLPYRSTQESPGVFLYHPTVPNYPQARFPAVVVFSEIYQVTGPVARFARQIAGHGYIVAAPSSYHEFTGPEALAYDGPGTDAGNDYKIQKVRPTTKKELRNAVFFLK